MTIALERPPAATAPLAVTFQLAEQRYALPLDAVAQVVRLPDLVVIAGAPPAVCGLLNLRGVFLPVLAGRRLVGAPDAFSLESCVVLVVVDGRPALGLLVDEVEAVRRFPPDGFARAGHSAPFVAGVLREREESAILLDPAALLAVAAGAQ
jgi:purine-binding chemotaxis protein CheW